MIERKFMHSDEHSSKELFDLLAQQYIDLNLTLEIAQNKEIIVSASNGRKINVSFKIVIEIVQSNEVLINIFSGEKFLLSVKYIYGSFDFGTEVHEFYFHKQYLKQWKYSSSRQTIYEHLDRFGKLYEKQFLNVK